MFLNFKNLYTKLKILLFENKKRGEIKKTENKNGETDSSEIVEVVKKSRGEKENFFMGFTLSSRGNATNICIAALSNSP